MPRVEFDSHPHMDNNQVLRHPLAFLCSIMNDGKSVFAWVNSRRRECR